MNSSEIIEASQKYIMNTYKRFPVSLVKGKGAWVWDTSSKKYLDFTCGIAVTSLGHSNPAIIDTIKEQIELLIHTSNLFYIQQQAQLGRILVENSSGDKTFFCNSGAEAVEAAIKLARKWGHQNGHRYKIISTFGSFHGRTMGALSATGNPKYHEGFEPLLEGFIFVPFGEIDPILKLIRQQDICAIILEPIQGENGVIIPPENYLKEVRSLCDKHNVLMILDEIQVGLGRTGKLFAYQHEKIEPDIITLAKSIASGIPCGAVIAKDEVASCFTPGNHGSTFGGNPLALSCAIKVLEIINDEELLSRIANKGKYFLEKLEVVAEKHSNIVKEIRGRGLIIGIEYSKSETLQKVTDKLIQKGLLTIPTAEKVTRILPPLIVSTEEIDIAIDIIDQVLEEVSS